MPTAQAPQPEGTDLPVVEWLRPAWLARRHLLASMVMGGALGVAVSFAFTPRYTSTTTFLPPQQQGSAAAALASLGSLASLAGVATGVKTQADQLVSLMQSATVADRMIDRFDLMNAYKAEFRFEAREELGERTRIHIGKKDGLVRVEVEDESAEKAARMANRYIDELRQMVSVLAVTEAQQRRKFFEKQMLEARIRLEAAQKDLQASGFTAGAIKAEPKAAAEAYARIRAELSAGEARLAALRSSRADSAPEVAQLGAAVAALRGQLRKLEDGQAGADASPAADYVGRYREFKYQETLFDMLARQHELARVDESREGALIQVVDVAQPAERKSSPRRSLFGLLCAAAALLLASARVSARAWARRPRTTP